MHKHWTSCILYPWEMLVSRNRHRLPSEKTEATACVLLTPLVTPFRSEPSWHSLCCLHVVTDGSSPAWFLNAQCSIGLAEGMGCQPNRQLPTSTGMHLVLYPFLRQHSTSFWFTLFLSCASSILSSQGTVSSSKMSCLVASEPKMMSGLIEDWMMWGGIFSCPSKSTVVTQSHSVKSKPTKKSPGLLPLSLLKYLMNTKYLITW